MIEYRAERGVEMKDFPIFTTEFGVASLILKEVPYRQTAYIHIRDTQEPEALLEECRSFCRICGAEHILAAGHPILEEYPLHTAIWELRGTVAFQPETLPQLWPVTEKTVGRWRELYNQKMRAVPNAGTLETREEGRILESGGAYFVHENGTLLGIGWLAGNRVEVIASVLPGAGERILCALQSLVPEELLTLEVASANEKALALYTRLGFLPVREISRWYAV